MTDLPDGILGFGPYEACNVVSNFVCAVCWSSLLTIQVQGDRIMLVVCPEHGNVELCGRITKNSVSIEMERGARNFQKVIRNLSDLWGHFIHYPEFKCVKCGNHQVEIEQDDEIPTLFHVLCPKHPHIYQSVSVKKEFLCQSQD